MKKIIRIILTIMLEVKTNIFNITALKMLFVKISSRAATNNIIAHFFPLFL